MCAICETFFRKNKQLLRGNMWNNYDTKVKKSINTWLVSV